jgi:hypothetical protein
MKNHKRYKKKKKFEVTDDVLRKLQDAMNDTIKPEYKDKKDGKGKGKGKNPRKKEEQPSVGSAERSNPEARV